MANTERERALSRSIVKYELLLELARTVEGSYHQHSNRGWMVSMFTLEAGTLMAVLAGSRARRWNALLQSLELDLLALKLERRQLRQRIADSAAGDQ